MSRIHATAKLPFLLEAPVQCQVKNCYIEWYTTGTPVSVPFILDLPRHLPHFNR